MSYSSLHRETFLSLHNSVRSRLHGKFSDEDASDSSGPDKHLMDAFYSACVARVLPAIFIIKRTPHRAGQAG